VTDYSMVDAVVALPLPWRLGGLLLPGEVAVHHWNH